MDSRRFSDVEKAGVLNLLIPLPIENNKPDFIKGLENEKHTLNEYLKNGSYNITFEYMFKTGEEIPVNVIGKLLNALQGYRISFYSVKVIVICNGFHQWFHQWPYQWPYQWPRQWSPTGAIRCFAFGFTLLKY